MGARALSYAVSAVGSKAEFSDLQIKQALRAARIKTQSTQIRTVRISLLARHSAARHAVLTISRPPPGELISLLSVGIVTAYCRHQTPPRGRWRRPCSHSTCPCLHHSDYLRKYPLRPAQLRISPPFHRGGRPKLQRRLYET